MTLSLNETHKLVKDAARGSSLSWGEADELARVAVWLEIAGQDGAGLAVATLADFSEKRVSGVALKRDEHWLLSPRNTPAPPQVSPLTAGITARDLALAEDATGASQVTIEDVRHPLLALGLIAAGACKTRTHLIATSTSSTAAEPLMLVCRNEDVYLSGTSTEGPEDIEIAMRPDEMNIGTMPHIWSPQRNRHAFENGVMPNPEALAALRKRAHNCLVPATEESRLKGAGAGTVDRD